MRRKDIFSEQRDQVIKTSERLTDLTITWGLPVYRKQEETLNGSKTVENIHGPINKTMDGNLKIKQKNKNYSKKIKETVRTSFVCSYSNCTFKKKILVVVVDISDSRLISFIS